MPTITIDGKELNFEQGRTILEVARDAEIDIPHFCWHPALSISGNCRMCFVEVEGAPKLVIGCATPAADGQVVHTQSDKAVQGREAIMEFLLINHPLDCPICDEAGQCKLQDYAFLHGRRESRFDEMKVRKEKRVPLGPQVLFDGERCISCSRCIRFADEIAEQPVLTFVNRGDHVSIETFPGTEFDSPYSMNVIDICPVGALTSVDFRFKARVWDMSFNPSICTGCSRGCNTHVGVRDNEILRLDPRTNMKVNEYWMCDPGRLETYPAVNDERYDGPEIMRGESQIPVSWEEALTETISKLREIKSGELLFVASPHATLEENHAFVRFAREVMGSGEVRAVVADDPSFADDLLRMADRTPNRKGLELLGVSIDTSVDRMRDEIEQGRVRGIVTLDDRLGAGNESFEEALDRLDVLIVAGSNRTPIATAADVLLARSTWAEQEGTYINGTGIVQHVEAAVATRENEARMGMKQSRLDKFGAKNDRWTQGEKRDVRPVWKTIATLSRLMGTPQSWSWSEDLFEELAGSKPELAGMSYAKLDEYRGIELGKGDRPTPHPLEYLPHDFRPQIRYAYGTDSDETGTKPPAGFDPYAGGKPAAGQTGIIVDD